ncbi:MAG: polysaccharide deacetylase family protein [Clostridia bacterium]|nr:polysaccharide deacetylase family protein [Clostridia bacterium]
MKVFVISKNTLIYIGVAVLAVIAAVLIAVLTGGSSSGEQPADPVAARPTQKPDSVQSMSSGVNLIEEYEVEVLAGLMKELPVYSVGRDDKKIALTIDAAWQDDKTPFILETLEAYNIKATFFLCGFWVNEHPDMVKRIYDAGHEIGNHSMTHPHMNKLSKDAIVKELNDFETAVSAIIGKKTTLFRAPYGEYNDNVVKTLRECGYEVIQWDIDTIDWREERSAKTILDSVLPRIRNGSIILSHNNGYKIEQYLPTLIETLLSQGYEFATVSELLLDGETLIDVNGVQKRVS